MSPLLKADSVHLKPTRATQPSRIWTPPTRPVQLKRPESGRSDTG